MRLIHTPLIPVLRLISIATYLAIVAALLPAVTSSCVAAQCLPITLLLLPKCKFASPPAALCSV